jgi:hypothetical protein
MIEKIEKTYAIFSRIFEGIEGNARDFVLVVKLLAYNRLSHSVSFTRYSIHILRKQYLGLV